MILEDRISSLPPGRWAIPLATHVGTDIPNDTCKPGIRITGLVRNIKEARLRKLYPCLREPIAGYNCFGMVFAARRAAIYDDGFIEVILAEDGYLQIDMNEVRVDDLVIYYSDKGPYHAARIVRREDTALVLNELTAPTHRPSLIVLSKFDDMTGEYEHNVDDTKWATESVTPKFYRARGKEPRYSREWEKQVRRIELGI
jgi:hypothetical protein